MSALNAQAEAVSIRSELDHVAGGGCGGDLLSVDVGVGLSVRGLGNLHNGIVGDVCRLGL
jgi:hypothetical protein